MDVPHDSILPGGPLGVKYFAWQRLAALPSSHWVHVAAGSYPSPAHKWEGVVLAKEAYTSLTEELTKVGTAGFEPATP